MKSVKISLTKKKLKIKINKLTKKIVKKKKKKFFKKKKIKK